MSIIRLKKKDLKKEREERKLRKKKWKEERLIRAMEKKLKNEQMQEEKQENSQTDDKSEETVNDAGCNYTVSIALPGSILDNAQSYELRTYLAGQIARAAVVFNINEIIIFDENGNGDSVVEGDFNGIRKKGEANVQLGRILQYLECPQYLRKFLFPKHQDLQYAGLLNPLDCPHHMRADEESLYREGLVLNKPIKAGRGSLVNIGLKKEVEVDKIVPHGMRVTVKLKNLGTEKLKGKIVSYSSPWKEDGIYWGYTVRLASCLSAVFAECPFDEEYDAIIGTSERGTNIDDFQMKKFKHALVVFGGVKGLEASLDADDNLQIDDPKYLFAHYLNTCPNQGSRTIRTEEAILITMSALRPKIEAALK